MGVDSKHPLYLKWFTDWELCQDCSEGQRKIKEERTKYLPATSGMVREGFGGPDVNALGEKMYEAYIIRAVFPGVFQETVIGMTSIVHRKPPTIEVPKAMERVIDSLTVDGEDLETMWRKITEAQLSKGRIGALVDVPDAEMVSDAVPYVALYNTEAIVNWDLGARRQGRRKLQRVVLDETADEMQSDLSWERIEQHRVAALAEAVGAVDELGVPLAPGYVVQEVRASDGGKDLSVSGYIRPSMGGIELTEIPFVFINAIDLAAEPCPPPLLSLANLALTIYRSEADYRQSLFLQGQDTLVLIGRTEEQKNIAVGAGATIDLPIGGQAEYVGVSSGGLPSQKEAIDSDKALAATFSVQLLDMKGGQAESGDALRIRVSARTANLSLMQHTAAAAIRHLLVFIGTWMGLNEAELEKIKVEPNLDFVDDGADANEVSLLVTAKASGSLPLSDESMHAWLVKHEYTSLTWEEEKKKIEQEKTDKGEGSGAIPGEDPFNPKPAPGGEPKPPPGGAPPPPFGGA